MEEEEVSEVVASRRTGTEGSMRGWGRRYRRERRRKMCKGESGATASRPSAADYK
jgi:hypothetical protein